MTLNDAQYAMTRTAIKLNIFLFALTAFFFNPSSIQAIGNPESLLPNSARTYKLPTTGDGDLLRGVYVADVLDLPVVQQPVDKPYYVSDRDGETTQFSMVSQYGNIGLLAHNTLSGKYFSKLNVGQEVRLNYEDGRTEYFVIKQILRFQALEPDSVASSFRNLDRNETISAVEMFNRAYVGERRLVFQTCIAAKGNASWGRLFVVATPRD